MIRQFFGPAIAIVFIISTDASAQTADVSPVIGELTSWLAANSLNEIGMNSAKAQSFAVVELSREDTDAAEKCLWNARVQTIQKERNVEMTDREIVIGELRMPFWYTTFGDAPVEGRSLFISMHGGGGAPAAVNDQQYENQKGLYKPAEGVYLVPRSPTNTWNLWHEAHIDDFFDRLITNMIVFENVNPNRVYLMGYSAGGDGVYQLAPRMADRLAAAAMMAGHPNESRPEGLRNIGFTIHMGANDAAYNRNQIAAEWEKKLDELQAADPDFYLHETTLHAGQGHWMNLQDAVAVPWMASFKRNAWPKRIVWVQDDVRHSRLYWLQVDSNKAAAGDEIIAIADGNTFRIEKCKAEELTLLLSDRLADLDQPVRVQLPDGTEQVQKATRTIRQLIQSLQDRNDPEAISSSRVSIRLNSRAINSSQSGQE